MKGCIVHGRAPDEMPCPECPSILHTKVSAVQFFGRRSTWPSHAVYVGMAGPSSRRFLIPDNEGLFGKPWDCLKHPLGWQVAYLRYLVNRLATDGAFRDAVRSLHGCTLLCWCAAKGSTHCHAMILAEFAELLAHEGEPR